MHEASIALAIAQEACERAETAQAQRVTGVYLRIGVLTSVVPDALQFAWDLATAGTVAAGSELRIEHVPLTIRCAHCNEERTVANGTLPVCPVCETSSTEIVRGRELLITAMEVMNDAQAARGSAEHSAQEQHAGA